MKTLIALLLMSAPAYAYDLKNLTAQDIMTIGQGLDELPRRATDANNLYGRIQSQLREQDAAAAKAQEDAVKEKLKKADETKKPDEPAKPTTKD